MNDMEKILICDKIVDEVMKKISVQLVVWS